MSVTSDPSWVKKASPRPKDRGPKEEKTESGTQIIIPRMPLPPLPKLDHALLRAETVQTADGRPLCCLVPSSEPYCCADPRAPILILIAGMGLDGTGLIRQLPLGSVSHVHLFNMPNTPAQGEVLLGQFARHVEDYIFAKKLDQHPGGIVLGGNSMGGATSLLIAIRRRVKLKGLALVGTFGHAKHLPFYQRLAAPLAWVVPMGLGHIVACRAAGMLRLFRQTSEEWTWIAHPPTWRTFSYYGHAVKALTTLDLIEEAKKIDVPTLVIHGKKDRVLRYACGEELASVIPGAKLVTVDSAGHNLFFTHAYEVNAALREFITDSKC